MRTATTDAMSAYQEWLSNPGPETMGKTLRALDPVISAEIHRYSGPRAVLKSKARELAIGAVRSYDPASKARLSSWVVTQMQPLNRYGKQVAGGSVRIPELAARQAAELNTVRMRMIDDLGDEPTDEQLADETGISVARVRSIKGMARPVVTEGQMEDIAAQSGGEGVTDAPAVEDIGTNPALVSAMDMVAEELDQRDRSILDMRTGRGGTPMLDNATIAKRLGISTALVSQRASAIARRIMEVQRNV